VPRKHALLSAAAAPHTPALLGAARASSVLLDSFQRLRGSDRESLVPKESVLYGALAGAISTVLTTS